MPAHASKMLTGGRISEQELARCEDIFRQQFAAQVRERFRQLYPARHRREGSQDLAEAVGADPRSVELTMLGDYVPPVQELIFLTRAMETRPFVRLTCDMETPERKVLRDRNFRSERPGTGEPPRHEYAIYQETVGTYDYMGDMVKDG